MQKNLVIVESPAKAKTIEKFLGKDYKVMSSYGHIRDLKKKDLGIDLANSYRPLYEVPADKEKLVSELQAAVNKADVVWLASDEDREGEAISWHLYETLGLRDKQYHRIVFHEITKNAILHAIENPRRINRDLVNAQQARRVLDRIVGFELSPVLWRKIKPSLSAGRVQSVTVRLVTEREREIEGFQSEAAYRIQATFLKKEGDTPYQINAELNKRLKTKEEALEFLNRLKDIDAFTIDSVITKPAKKSPAAPFTTSTLQQEAARKLGFSVAQTMSVAQKLYESGKITYMRTDSVHLSALAINASKDEISEAYGKKYVKTRQFSTKSKGAQEAHEAIRPSYMNAHQTTGTSQEQKLYELIWKRTIASQMADAELERTTVTINIFEDEDVKFVSSGEVITFDGFLRVYLESTDDESADNSEESTLLPPIMRKDILGLKESTATERFTQRPARYSEASLVRKLEELGIGRPSTYAPTISTIQNREYVEKTNIEGTDREYNVLQLKKGKITDVVKTEKTGADKNKLKPTDTGIVVNDYLTEFFPRILDYNFTADVEKEFDYVAVGAEIWTDMIDRFYKKFHPVVEEAMNTHEDHKVGERILGTDPKSGKQISAKIGRFGPMIQLGTQDDEEKPRFVSLRKGQSLGTISIEEAIMLFDLPRPIGEYEEKELTASIGKFGPYIRFDGKFISLPKELDPYTITQEEAIELIEAKRKQDREKLIKIFEGKEGKDDKNTVQILNGRYGPYIAYKEKNYKIAKTVDAATLTLKECMEIIKNTKSKTKAKVEKKDKKKTKVTEKKKKVLEEEAKEKKAKAPKK